MEDRVWHRQYDQQVPATLDLEDLPLAEMLARTTARAPDVTALIFKNRRLAYRELKDHVDRLATALAAMGVGKDSRVAIQMPNLPQAVISFYATLSLGAQAVMTNPLYMPREIEHQWNDAGCETAITMDFLYADKLAPIRSKLPVRHYVVASIPEYLGFPLDLIAPFKLRRAKPRAIARVDEAPDVHHFRKLVERTEPRPQAVAVSWDDLAVLQYTGGTTGVSKGAMLTHGNLSANVQQLRAWLHDVRQDDEVVLAALPYFHVFGLMCCMAMPVYIGSTIVIIPNPRDTKAMISSIRDHRVTVFNAVPTMFHAINHFPHVGDIDISSVKACFSGSAPLATDTSSRFHELTGATIIEGFGLTETSPVTHCNPYEGTKKPGTVGVPVSNTDARIVDAEDGGKDVVPGAEGELIIRGPQVMAGYWNREDETRNSLRDGWLYTGDLATMDEDGYFRIVGRKKDMIVAGGYNVYPDEIDDVLMSHESILEACTIGLPHPKLGETVKAFVVLVPGATLGKDEIVAWCKERLAAYKVPRAIEFRDELPKSSMMKVLRRELRDEELARAGTHQG